jgi:RNA polymerase sigma factor (sigma-70 family)
MESDSPSATSASLLRRLSDPQDREAWGTFVARYRDRIHAWCRRWGLQEADAEDMTQSLLLALPARMRNFAYDPARGSFRGWLKTVVRHAVGDFVQREARVRGVADPAALEQVAAVDDLLTRLREAFDLELFEEAMQRVRQRVRPVTWDAFRLTALENRPGKEAAALLGLQVAIVHVYRSRVQGLIRAEVQALEGDGYRED